MANKYVNFVSDDHLLHCVGNLHKSYLRAKNQITKKKIYANKVDTIKLTFDALFNNIEEESLIQNEILRQVDKSINNAIGTFHEQVLGGVKGYQIGSHSGYDIKANDNTLYADIKNKHNTMNSSSAESLFQKLARYADDNKKAKCYWVQILAKSSFNTPWAGIINKKEYSHSRVFKISGDLFYSLITGQDDALFQLYKALPVAIKDYLENLNHDPAEDDNSAIEEIKKQIERTKLSILDQITLDNFKYYTDFKKLL